MSVPNMKAKPPRLNEEPYAGKLLVRIREGLGRQLPGQLDSKRKIPVLGKLIRSSGILCCFLYIPAISVNAPYLIDVVAQSSRIALVSWRNNDLNTQSFIIQRRNVNSQNFEPVAGVKASVSEYNDSLLLPSQGYIFRIVAIAASDTSLPSNEDTVQMLPGKAVVRLSGISYDSLCHCFQLKWQDSCESETRFDIFRSESPNLTSFIKLKEIISSDPLTMGLRSWTDSNTTTTMYRYLVMALIPSGGTPACTTGNVFALDYAHLILPSDTLLVMDSIKWGFPIRHKSWSWSIKSGDSLFLKEDSTSAPFTILNISNPQGPSFSGYGTQSVNGTISTSALVIGTDSSAGYFVLWTYDNGFHQRMLCPTQDRYGTAFQFIGDSTFLWTGLRDPVNCCKILPDTFQNKYLGILPNRSFREIPYGKVWSGVSYIQAWSGQVIVSLVDGAISFNPQFNMDRIPDHLGKYCVIDTFKTFYYVHNRILDEKRKLVYCFCNNALWAYSYKLLTKQEYDLTSAINPKHVLREQKEPSMEPGYYEAYDCLGRRILSSFQPSNVFTSKNRFALSQQLFIIVYKYRNAPPRAYVQYGKIEDILRKLKMIKE